MCPDNTLLSAFHDGEVTSPWKEKIEAHLLECEDCRTLLEGMENQSRLLQDDEEPGYESSFEDIQKLIRHKKNTGESSHIREFRLPVVPLAAAAAAVMAFFMGFIMAGNTGPAASFTDIPLAVSEGWSVPPGDLMVPGEDIEAMLSMIEQGNSSMFDQETSMELPVDLNLALIGDSQLVRTASYSGGSSR